ncbi:MAG: family 10 glycosylhydrolase [Fuerstiella sp.]|nr:family 10 glycosylhydrolase [Fuerstiella sp.]MCP4852939.1 family 10 glycosylhydrolase [Fuerstiella sp.]
MHISRDQVSRRRALQAGAVGVVGVSVRRSHGASEFVLSAEHRTAVNRIRRIVVQYDSQTAYGVNLERWIDYRCAYIDEPGSQIDSVFLDMGRLGQVLYPSKFLDPLVNADFQKWRAQGIDVVERQVAEFKKRGLEVFWNHRVSEVDLNVKGTGAAWKDKPAPLKKAHPDWVLDTPWWRHGLWNFSVPAVREHTVKALREVAEMYDLDGLQLDFARHVPCLPVGRQWELRGHVTELMRLARRMMLDIARKRGRPLLLAAKVPRNLDGCRIDGFDIEVWAKENLVDVLTLGSRSLDIDLAGYRRLTAKSHIKLLPCFDDHHATDGYRYAPIEVLRGVFANWWQQGADGVSTFNWSNAPPELCRQMAQRPGPLTHQMAYHEVGNPATMLNKDKTFVVERQGGYPWATGFFNRNDTAPLPRPVSREEPLLLNIADDLPQQATKVKRLFLRAIIFGAKQDDAFDATLNGVVLKATIHERDWKDPQIFSPKPQPASGGKGAYRVNSSQKLLRVEFAVEPQACRVGGNHASIQLREPTHHSTARPPQLEKLELHVQYS